MKNKFLLYAVILVVVLLIVGLSAEEVKASYPSPEDMCTLQLIALRTSGAYIVPGSRWIGTSEQCVFGFEDNGSTNVCFPLLDIYQVEWIGSGGDYDFEFTGCQSVYTRLFREPGGNWYNLGGGISFGFEPYTCDAGCSVTKFGLTGAAKNALGLLRGKVLGKSYLQIRDGSGNLAIGDFKLCYYAKGSENPHFFRFGGANSWVPMGGYWEGRQFCMNGTISGNYVMIEMP